MAWRLGMVRRTCAAMLPSVLLPSSSYSAASGSSPMPTLSRTIRMARENTLTLPRLRRGETSCRPDVSSRVVRREIIRDAAGRTDRGDRVLENQVIHPRVFNDQRKSIEVLDAGFELAAIQKVHGDWQLFPARVIQEYVLNIRRAG